MIITPHIRNLVRQIDDLPIEKISVINGLVAELVEALTVQCNNSEVKKRYSTPLYNNQTTLKKYPVDQAGYAIALDPLEDEELFIKTFQEYNMVVGKHVVSKHNCDQLINRINKHTQQLSNGECSLDNPETHGSIPKDEKGVPLLSRGFYELYHDNALAQIRQSVRMYIHHVLIRGNQRLWTSFDRVGIKLPNHQESKGLSLHVDQNPNIHPSFTTIQGILALDDCPVERGTFLGIPGSKSYFCDYASMAKNHGEYVQLDHDSWIKQIPADYKQAIPLRAGDLVSRDSRMTHANTSNISQDTRYVCMVAAGPAREYNHNALQVRKEAFKTGLGSNVREALMHASMKPRYTNRTLMNTYRNPEEMTLLGELLYGHRSYDHIT